jgi:hypothetical protein
MAAQATAASRIVQGLDDLQTFTSELERIRSLVRILEGRRSPLLDAAQPANGGKRGRAGFFRRLGRSG